MAWFHIANIRHTEMNKQTNWDLFSGKRNREHDDSHDMVNDQESSLTLDTNVEKNPQKLNPSWPLEHAEMFYHSLCTTWSNALYDKLRINRKNKDQSFYIISIQNLKSGIKKYLLLRH